MNIGIYPGSFDPLTRGHFDIIEKSAKLCNKLYVVVANNDSKKHLFDINQRYSIVSEATKNIKNVEVIVLNNGYVSNKAKELNANLLIRGIRDSIDLNYEFSLEQFTRSTNDNLETIYFSPKPENMFVSSSLVRNLLNAGFKEEAVKFLVPTNAEEVLKYIK